MSNSIWFGAKLIMDAFLFLALGVEAVVIISLIFKTGLRVPMIMALNCFKQGKGPLIIQIIQTTLFALFLFSVYSILNISGGLNFIPAADGSLNQSDHLVLLENSLRASITGIFLFLSLVIEKLHPLIVEGVSLENITKVEEKLLSDKKLQYTKLLTEHEFMLKRLKATNRKLEFEFQMKKNEAKVINEKLSVLKRNAEGFQAEYDRMFEYNQILKNQLQPFDQRLLNKDTQETGGWAKLKSNLLAWGNANSPKGSDEEVCENEVNATERCDRLLYSSISEKSSPRHRRPIYQF